MILDYLLRLRDGGTTTTIDASEAGTTTTLSRVATTGQSVIDLKKTNRTHGLSVVVVNGAGAYTTYTDTFVVTIEGSSEEDFDTAALIQTLITFPHLPETGVTTTIAAGIMVRRLFTQLRYVRSVITVSATLATALTLSIFIGDLLEEQETAHYTA